MAYADFARELGLQGMAMLAMFLLDIPLCD